MPLTLLAAIGVISGLQLTSSHDSTDIAVLTTAELIVVSTETWTVRERVALNSPHVAEEWPSRRMALLGDSTIVLLARQEVALVRIDPLRIVERRPMPEGEYSSLAADPDDGSITVCGNDRHDGVILDVQPHAASTREVARIPGTATANWVIYQCAWSEQASRLYVSYHGPTTTGVDWFIRRNGRLVRCESRRHTNVGCIAVHGGFVLRDEHLFGATGGPGILVTSLNGDSISTLDTGLHGAHLMEFAVDTGDEYLYALAPCGYVPGFSRTQLSAPGATTRSSTSLCSGQITAVGSYLASLAPGSWYLDVIDRETGQSKARVYLGAPGLDVLPL